MVPRFHAQTSLYTLTPRCRSSTLNKYNPLARSPKGLLCPLALAQKILRLHENIHCKTIRDAKSLDLIHICSLMLRIDTHYRKMARRA
jgi:hypothetical protein